MGLLQSAEKSLGDLFKGAPKISDSAKETIVKIWPWLALLGGIGSALAALSAFNWARSADELTNYVNTLYGATVIDSRWSVWIWVSLIILAVEAVLLLAAFPKLQKRQKGGWDLLFLVALINLVYAVVSLFSDYYGGFGSPIFSLLVSAVVFWLLFATRDKYHGAKATS